MIHLSVNLNKVALIRNSRGKNIPHLLQVAQDCVRFGADGITVHPRPDERHTRYQDIYVLKEGLDVELNVEGYPSDRFMRMIEETRPAQCTLVPDPPGALTSDAGWDTLVHGPFLTGVLDQLRSWGVRSSIFIEPDIERIRAAKALGTDRVELYTEAFAQAHAQGDQRVVATYAQAGEYAKSIGLGLNAGHDLNLENLSVFAAHLPFLDEVSIGHALVSDALYLGFEETIRRYQACLGKTDLVRS